LANFKAVKLYILTLCVLIGFIFPVMGQDQLSNLEIADQTFFSVLDSVFEGVPEPELKFSGLGDEEEAFLRSGWIQYWADKSDRKSVDSLVCTIDRIYLRFQYFDKTAHLFGLNEDLTRKSALSVQGWVANGSTNKIFQAIKVSKLFTDVIESGDLKQIERGPFTFLKGEFSTRSLWTRYLEPALVIVSVTAIVYLFFSVRT